MTWDYCFSLVSTNNATDFDCNILGPDLLLLIDSSCSFLIKLFFFFGKHSSCSFSTTCPSDVK